MCSGLGSGIRLRPSGVGIWGKDEAGLGFSAVCLGRM